MKNNFKKVLHEEYVAFLKSWPRKLTFDLATICEPPVGTWNDFSRGKVWPDSVVAKEIHEPNGVERYYVLDIKGEV